METAVLLIRCPDAKGLVAQISNWVSKHDANIIQSDQHSSDAEHGVFFMRTEFCFDASNLSFESLRNDFKPLAEKISAVWSIHDRFKKPSANILVSQHDHCLYDLLYHCYSGDIPFAINSIISNHKTTEKLAEQFAIPFHYLSVTGENKAEQEHTLLSLVNNSDFLVLARYMQILSDDFLKNYQSDIINIHHSFLPSFVGAHPYRQAYDRGVKVIGATAHYVTAELDEGPIIAQCVESVSHRDSIDDLKLKGKNLEKIALAKAVKLHCERRVIRYKNKTVVFD